MQLADLLTRISPPEAWSEGDNIPWNEPGFSARMLEEHLSQSHDAASRRLEVIYRHVRWIHTEVLHGHPSEILDLGCGPGLYGERLARLGHAYRGMDFSPASLEYARLQAETQQLACEYQLGDLRTADFGPDHAYDLVMQIYGEMNVFRPADMLTILRKAQRALKPGGVLLLEVAHEQAVRRIGSGGCSWFTAPRSLFSTEPHLVLEENFWDEQAMTATSRYYIVQLADGSVRRMASSQQAYTQEQYRRIVASCGFMDIHIYPGLAVPEGETPGDFLALTAIPTLDLSLEQNAI